MAKSLQQMFNLTAMTGKQSSGDRQVTMFSFDMARRTQIIIMCSGLPGLLVGGALFPVIGFGAIFVIALFIGVGFYFFHFKSPDGLEQRKYKEFLTKRKSKNSKYMRGMEVVTIGQAKMDWIVRTVGQVPFELLHPDIQKLTDRDRWEREEQQRYEEQVWSENKLKDKIKAQERSIADQAQTQLDRKNERKTKKTFSPSSLKMKLRRTKPEDSEDQYES
ncbi:hypothetical protein ACTXJX_14875 [Glutamicibacter ardleyensis]|uniref:hypothetical protein n=1 Tax=Glutamicibacter ardleyensis TaxID=225894 RepID=UPI003FD3C18E